MEKRVSSLKVNIVPNGVDTNFFTFRRKINRSELKTVLFVGNFKWLQNREAVSILIREVWPKIKTVLKDKVRLWIVGKSPPSDILKKQVRDIKVYDDIDDIRRVYQKADVLLAPIYGPGGTRYKILESMAAGIPVVTTSTGIEGLSAKNAKEVLVAEDSSGLANLTIRVLTDENLYKKLAFSGRRLVEDKYSWKTIARDLDNIYEQAV